MIMQESLMLAELLIPMDLHSRVNSSGCVARKVFTWVIVLGLVCMQGLSVASASQRAASSGVSPTPIRLVLQTSKRTYRASEPIEITAYLENVSQDRTYYVGKGLGNLFSIESFHYIELQITDEKGREVQIGRGAGASVWKFGTTIAEKLALEYIQLQQGMFYGRKFVGDLPIRPGQYWLVATYREEEALAWTEAERKALSIPVWMQSLVSNTVTITVLP